MLFILTTKDILAQQAFKRSNQQPSWLPSTRTTSTSTTHLPAQRSTNARSTTSSPTTRTSARSTTTPTRSSGRPRRTFSFTSSLGATTLSETVRGTTPRCPPPKSPSSLLLRTCLRTAFRSNLALR